MLQWTAFPTERFIAAWTHDILHWRKGRAGRFRRQHPENRPGIPPELCDFVENVKEVPFDSLARTKAAIPIFDRSSPFESRHQSIGAKVWFEPKYSTLCKHPIKWHCCFFYSSWFETQWHTNALCSWQEMRVMWRGNTWVKVVVLSCGVTFLCWRNSSCC